MPRFAPKKAEEEPKGQKQKAEKTAAPPAHPQPTKRPTIQECIFGPERARLINSMSNWQNCNWLRAGGKASQAEKYANMERRPAT